MNKRFYKGTHTGNSPVTTSANTHTSNSVAIETNLARDCRNGEADERGNDVSIIVARVVDGAAALDGSAVAAVDSGGGTESAERGNEESGELGEHFLIVKKVVFASACRCD